MYRGRDHRVHRRRNAERGSEGDPREAEIVRLQQRIAELEMSRNHDYDDRYDSEQTEDQWEGMNPFADAPRGFRRDHHDDPLRTIGTKVEQIFNLEYVPEPFVDEDTEPIYDTDGEEEEAQEDGWNITLAALVLSIARDFERETDSRSSLSEEREEIKEVCDQIVWQDNACWVRQNIVCREQANKHRMHIVYGAGDSDAWKEKCVDNLEDARVHVPVGSLRADLVVESHAVGPAGRSRKLKMWVDDSFRILEIINDKAFKIELPGHYNVTASFNLSPYVEDSGVDVDSRTSLFEEGEDDAYPYDPGGPNFITKDGLGPITVAAYMEGAGCWVEKVIMGQETNGITSW